MNKIQILMHRNAYKICVCKTQSGSAFKGKT